MKSSRTTSTTDSLQSSMLLGAHMSTQGGVFRALERGHSIDCSTIQIFTKNANRWAASDLLPEDIRAFKALREQTGINPVFAHCSYLINLACAGDFYQKSIEALAVELLRGEQLGLEFVVLHPGAHMGYGETEGLKRVVDALDEAFEKSGTVRCKVAIENTAGQGSCIGCTFEQLEYITRNTGHPKRVGVCIDTCHLFAAGYDIRTPQKYSEVIHHMLDCIPKNKILAFHLNDSKRPLGSRVDRHEHIGKGYIGDSGFASLLRDDRFSAVPKVLETPKGKDMKEDVMNLKRLRRLANRSKPEKQIKV